MAARNLSLADSIRLWQLNFASRLVGFFLRTVVISVALIALGLGLLLSAVALSVWLVTPLLYTVLPIIAGFVALRL